jgi:hypothetical protein
VNTDIEMPGAMLFCRAARRAGQQRDGGEEKAEDGRRDQAKPGRGVRELGHGREVTPDADGYRISVGIRSE